MEFKKPSKKQIAEKFIKQASEIADEVVAGRDAEAAWNDVNEIAWVAFNAIDLADK